MDMRGRRYFGEELERSLEAVEREQGWDHRILFIDSDDPSLVRRYKESRRPHPAARNGDVLEAIRRERRDLSTVREMADLVVDTSGYSTLDARLRFKKLAESFSSRLTVSLTSFGFKHGIPMDVDTLLDARFLPNPHHDPDPRPLQRPAQPPPRRPLPPEPALRPRPPPPHGSGRARAPGGARPRRLPGVSGQGRRPALVLDPPLRRGGPDLLDARRPLPRGAAPR